MQKEISAGVVIFKEDKQREYLLLHYEQGHWDFVKGNVEKGEIQKETVIRETKEETGITKIEFIEGFKKRIHYFYKQKNELVSKSVYFYLAKTEQKQIKLSFEHIGYKWLNYEKALKQLTFNTAKDILKKAEEFLREYNKQKKIRVYCY
jgi:8-oxo-dGTP pyrophosphatase MutT (NUDIX family)